MRVVVPEIFRTTIETLSWVANVAHRGVVQSRNDIILDFSNVKEFDENLCVVLGVLIERWKNKKRIIDVCINNPEILERFKQIGFFSEFSLQSRLRGRGAFGINRKAQIAVKNLDIVTMPYKKFIRTDVKAQANYVHRLMASPWWPMMTAKVRDVLGDCILEVFNNAAEHSDSECGTFVCGHIVNINQRMMYVSIADAGVGFRRKIESALGVRMSSSDAIEWGMKEGNTVRKENPGGLGLKILKEFINVNNGKLIVLSDRGYWELANKKEIMREFDFAFPGTVVTIVVNTEDCKAYRMASEVTN